MAGGSSPKIEDVEGWRLALLLLAFATLTVALEWISEKLEKLFERRKGLSTALAHVKNELLYVGTISLLLSAFQEYLARICIPKDTADVYSDSVGVRRHRSRRQLLAGSTAEFCTGSTQSLWPVSLQHDTHVKKWRVWEDEAQEQARTGDVKVMQMPAGFLYWNVGSNPVVHWLMMLTRSGTYTVNQTMYHNARLIFVENMGLPYDFHFHATLCPPSSLYPYPRPSYTLDLVVVSLEEELSRTLRPEWHLWLVAVVWFAIPPPSYVSFWMYGISLTLLLVIGGKLLDILVQIAVQVAIKYGDSVLYGRMKDNARAGPGLTALGRSSLRAGGFRSPTLQRQFLDRISSGRAGGDGGGGAAGVEAAADWGPHAGPPLARRSRLTALLGKGGSGRVSGRAGGSLRLAAAPSGLEEAAGGSAAIAAGGGGRGVKGVVSGLVESLSSREAAVQLLRSWVSGQAPPPALASASARVAAAGPELHVNGDGGGGGGWGGRRPPPLVTSATLPREEAGDGVAAAAAAPERGSAASSWGGGSAEIELTRGSAPPASLAFRRNRAAAAGSGGLAEPGGGAAAAAPATVAAAAPHLSSIAEGSPDNGHSRERHNRHNGNHNHHHNRNGTNYNGHHAVGGQSGTAPPPPPHAKSMAEDAAASAAASAAAAAASAVEASAAPTAAAPQPELSLSVDPAGDPAAAAAGACTSADSDGDGRCAIAPCKEEELKGSAAAAARPGVTFADGGGGAAGAPAKLLAFGSLPRSESVGRRRVPLLLRPCYCGAEFTVSKGQYVRDLLNRRRARGVHKLDAAQFFWFGRPRFVTALFTIAYFQNSLSIAICVFSLLGSYKSSSTWEGVPLWAVIVQLVIDLLLVPQVSLGVLPLYALIQPLGSHCPRSVLKSAMKAGLYTRQTAVIAKVLNLKLDSV
ncbi:hypothetical protein GPECTOR_25g360 [Gonium pectorale]|uniref:MLO-like protein n=1 Tax=Gonium pectorale TaxID=33097 RepID=A0A150GG21_GONPE|nr:hypothetical protein GPECTOR_25g360 [Gonium pectorale]|eukprot:KXZ48776.1 hypothetical protein GPECTOR_25g360 [Gonium pectorale]